MKIFSYDEKQALINYTIANEGIVATDFTDRVGDKVAAEIANRWSADSRMLVFAGWETNGAEALDTARHLLDQGYHPEIFLFNIGGNRLTPLCASCRKRLIKAHPDCQLTEVTTHFDPPVLNPHTVVVDGLFGGDLDKPLPRSFSMLIRTINESGAKIVSIEIPSGLFSEWNTINSIHRDIMHATLTLAIETPYLSFFFEDSAKLVGEWHTINVGLDHEALRRAPYTYYLITRRDIHSILRPRPAEASKADFGSALICGGSYGMMGAALLATRGCLRAGAGKVTCMAPHCGYQVIQGGAPSAMFRAAQGENAIERISIDRDYRGIGVGIGMGTSDETINAMENLLKLMSAKSQPLVIDADALNCIALRPRMLDYLPTLSVLTPHHGEFDRIFGSMPSTEARLRKAIEAAKYHNVVIVLKGRYTAIVRPDGKVYINSSGTPAMATGGSGDVLTGVITSFMAQGMNPEIAALVGVYVHGVAGEIAEESQGSYGVIADDIASSIGHAIKKIME